MNHLIHNYTRSNNECDLVVGLSTVIKIDVSYFRGGVVIKLLGALYFTLRDTSKYKKKKKEIWFSGWDLKSQDIQYFSVSWGSEYHDLHLMCHNITEIYRMQWFSRYLVIFSSVEVRMTQTDKCHVLNVF